MTQTTLDPPLWTAADRLAQLLADRSVRARAPGVPVPQVVALGAADTHHQEVVIPGRNRASATVHLTSRTVLVGPWPLRPGAGCGHCLAIRWQRLRERYERDALEVGSGLRQAGVWPLVTGYLAEVVWSVYEMMASAPVDPGALPIVSTVDIATLAVDTVPLLAEPRCPSCSVPQDGSKPPEPLTLTSRQKKDAATYRMRSPREIELSTEALANPVCGAIGANTHIDLTSPTNAPVSGGITTRVATDGLVDVGWSGHADTYEDSQNLALLEGLERYAGTHPRRNVDAVVDSLANLGDLALNPRDCGVYSPETYATDKRLREFSDDAPIPWVWGHSLRDDRPILVPARLPYYAAGTGEQNFVYGSSSGCASGSCREEAILFGLLELIERDAFMLGWYGGADLTEIDLDTVDDQETRRWIDRAALFGYDIHLFDNRIDLAVPVVTALAVKRDGGFGNLCFTAGANLDPIKAIRAAVCEVVTFIPSLARRVRERRVELEGMADDFAKVRVLADHAVLFGLPRMATHARRFLEPKRKASFDEVYFSWSAERPRTNDLVDDVVFCRDELIAAGYDVIVIDQTTPEQDQMGLASVATLVPGLIPIDFGWHLQRALRLPRMFTAFQRAGWRDAPLTLSDLHLVPHPFP